MAAGLSMRDVAFRGAPLSVYRDVCLSNKNASERFIIDVSDRIRRVRFPHLRVVFTRLPIAFLSIYKYN